MSRDAPRLLDFGPFSTTSMSLTPEATKRCPFCAEEILSAAIKCKHCGSELTAETRALGNRAPLATTSGTARRSRVVTATAILGLVALLAVAAIVALRPTTFRCFNQRTVGPGRTCAPDLSECDQHGCFAQRIAYCFMARYPRALRNKPDPGHSVCAPTLEECRSWHRSRAEGEDDTLGECTPTEAGDYVAP